MEQFYVYVLYIVVCPLVHFHLAIVLSVLLWLTDSDYPFGIFKLVLYMQVFFIAGTWLVESHHFCVYAHLVAGGMTSFNYIFSVSVSIPAYLLYNGQYQCIFINQMTPERQWYPDVVLSTEVKSTAELLTREVKSTDQLLTREVKSTAQLLTREVKSTAELLTREVKRLLNYWLGKKRILLNCRLGK